MKFGGVLYVNLSINLYVCETRSSDSHTVPEFVKEKVLPLFTFLDQSG